MPSTPVKVKVRKLKPTLRPRLACRLPPSTPIMSSGNTSVVTRRGRSRRSFIRSRWAIARTGASSLIGVAKHGQVGFFERRLVDADHGERRLEDFEQLVRTAIRQLDVE